MADVDVRYVPAVRLTQAEANEFRPDPADCIYRYEAIEHVDRLERALIDLLRVSETPLHDGWSMPPEWLDAAALVGHG